MTREERANAAAHELFFQAQVGLGEGIADAAERIAAAMLSFADDEAAAMRERAAKVCDHYAEPTDTPDEFTNGFEACAVRAAKRIRALSTRGEG